MSQTSAVGSRSLTGRRNHGLGWLPWAALGLLALLALLALLVIRNVADDGDSTGLDTRDDPAASATTPSRGAQQGAAAGTASAALSAGGRDLLQVAAAGGLGGLAGQPVQGTGATVESVVADEAFWVGSPGRRVLVFLTPQARTKAGESPFQVQAGQRIDLTGTVKPLPADITPFGVDRNEGADELRGQAHYVEATSVALS
jgi:hypothetical protein